MRLFCYSLCLSRSDEQSRWEFAPWLLSLSVVCSAVLTRSSLWRTSSVSKEPCRRNNQSFNLRVWRKLNKGYPNQRITVMLLILRLLGAVLVILLWICPDMLLSGRASETFLFISLVKRFRHHVRVLLVSRSHFEESLIRIFWCPLSSYLSIWIFSSLCESFQISSSCDLIIGLQQSHADQIYKLRTNHLFWGGECCGPFGPASLSLLSCRASDRLLTITR